MGYVEHPADEWIRARGEEARQALEAARKAGLVYVAAELERRALAYERELDRRLKEEMP